MFRSLLTVVGCLCLTLPVRADECDRIVENLIAQTPVNLVDQGYRAFLPDGDHYSLVVLRVRAGPDHDLELSLAGLDQKNPGHSSVMPRSPPRLLQFRQWSLVHTRAGQGSRRTSTEVWRLKGHET